MAQTTYEEYLKQFGSAAAAQPTGMMQPQIAMPDVSGIQGAVQNIQNVNSAYKIPERADLNKVREDFLDKKAEDATKELEQLLSPSNFGGGYESSGGMMTDAAFAGQLSQGIMNVQALMEMGLIPESIGKALIADAYGKAFPGYDNPGSVAPGTIGHAGYTAFSPVEGGGWGDGGTGVGVGGGSVGAGGGNAAGGFSHGGW